MLHQDLLALKEAIDISRKVSNLHDICQGSSGFSNDSLEVCQRLNKLRLDIAFVDRVAFVIYSCLPGDVNSSAVRGKNAPLHEAMLFLPAPALSRVLMKGLNHELGLVG